MRPNQPGLLIYCQHLKGAGHYVRARELARACADRFRVCLVAGGRPVPSSSLTLENVEQRSIAGLWRPAGDILPIEVGCNLDETMLERTRQLINILEERKPDVLLIEHFPFSKWFFESEILAMLQAGRRLNPSLKVVCSIRDYPIGHEWNEDPDAYREKVVPLLNNCFDLLLVHADPQVVTLDQQFPWATDLQIPVRYTGFVSEPVPMASTTRSPGLCRPTRGDVVVSTGGLWDGWRLATLAIQAWRRLDCEGVVNGRCMHVFAGLDATGDQLAEFDNLVDGHALQIHSFNSSFLGILKNADLSISQGGYNTTMNVLSTGVRAIVAPSRRTQDQWPRALRLAEMGLLSYFDSERSGSAELATLMKRLLEIPPPRHELVLDGQTRASEGLWNLL